MTHTDLSPALQQVHARERHQRAGDFIEVHIQRPLEAHAGRQVR